MTTKRDLLQIALDRERCTDCLACIGVCPNYVFAAQEDGRGNRRLDLRYAEQCCVL